MLTFECATDSINGMENFYKTQISRKNPLTFLWKHLTRYHVVFCLLLFGIGRDSLDLENEFLFEAKHYRRML